MSKAITHVLLPLCCLGLVALVVYLYNQRTELETQLDTTTQTFSETKLALQAASSTLAERNRQIADMEEELEETKDDLRDAEEDLEAFEDEYRATIDTVNDLNKLSQIDEELLQQYSRVYFLNENYVPEKLTEIDEDFLATSTDDEYFLDRAWPFLEDLLEDAERDGVDLRVVSAYRSFDEQAQLKGDYLQTYGEGANTFSADQGYSEHQLGTTLDFSTPELNGELSKFGETEAYEWLLDNAYKHGFILSYPEDNEFYIFEPWHWRFVGEDLARDLERDDRSFYEVPQRELNEYRLELFD